jgi:lanthanide-dependent methanol dehydrogenase
VTLNRADAGSRSAGPRAELAQPIVEDGEWRMAARDHANVRYSRLTDIDVSSVQHLRFAWAFATGADKGHEAAPLVVGSTMYLSTPFPNKLFALDLTKPGPPVKWVYDPHPNPASQGIACCDVVNRGAAYDRGRIFFNTLDDHTIALDAETGRELWRAKLGDINKGETMTMAPLVVKDQVLVGNSGGELGVRGWITSLDVNTGAIRWRAYSTGPDQDVLIGPQYRPFYPQDRGTDLGVKTWRPDQWQIGGGTVWGWLSYDPGLDLLFYGTANPSPWNPELRPGTNHFTAGIFARKPDTGEAVWFYQWSPHDEFDYDGVNEAIVLDVPVRGEMRRALVSPQRNGYVYVLDRATGEVLSAEPFAHITTSTGVNTKTGVIDMVKAKSPGLGRVVRNICPAAPGAKDWQPSSFSPRTGLLYIPHQNLCQDEEGTQASYIAGTPYLAANVRMYPGPGNHRGEMLAWDPASAKPAWAIQERFPVWTGALATEGDVVFYGTMDASFKALHAVTGELLWQTKLPSGSVGQPMTYRGPDGKQYVAIFAGVGGWAGTVVSNDLDPQDPTGAAGFVGAMSDLPSATGKGGTLLVYGLP